MKKNYILFLALVVLGFSANAQVVVNQAITTNTTWTSNNTYLLDGFVYVKNGATLTIQAGTTIKGKKETKGGLIITRGAKLIANGTQSQPIVFTSNEATPNYGDWTGLLILGKAPTNTSFNGVDGVGVIEGGVNNAEGDGLYGGTDAADNSGVLRYVRVEYSGIAIAANNETNGITFGGVGNGTTVENVQVSYCGDDAFEWFGGTVNCKNLIAYRALDDDFDCDFGFQGKVQNAFCVRDPLVADISGSNGFEVDNDATGTDRTPKTAPTFSNVTIVGPSGAGIAGDYKRAAHLRRNNEIGIFNSLFLGQYPVGIFIDGATTEANATANKLEVKNCIVAGPTELLKGSAAFNTATWFGTTGWGNSSYVAAADAKLQAPFAIDAPNLAPATDSPARNAASFAATRLQGGFFTTYSHIGAFDGTNDWTCQWSKFASGVNTTCIMTDTKDFDRLVSAVKVYPTVANQSTMLELEVAEKTDVNVRILDLSGRYFGTPVSQVLTPGTYNFPVEVSHLPAGFYLMHIEAGAAMTTEKLIIVR